MSKWKKISESEKQIMEILWSNEHPITTSEILSKLPEGRQWKQNTVITFLARLIEKGIVKAKRKGRANYYEACLTAQEYRSFETKQFIQDVHQGSVSGLISTLGDSGDITKEDIENLMELIKQ